MYAAPDEVWLVFVEHWLVVVMWTAAGAAVAASRHHRPSRWSGFLLAAALVAMAESAIGTPVPGSLDFAVGLGFAFAPPVAVVVLVCACP